MAVGGRAEADTARASFAVSVTVADQCVVRPVSRLASCTGGAGYAVAVARETLSAATTDQLTDIGDHAHTIANGSLIAISSSATGQPSAGGGQGLGLGMVEPVVARTSDQVEAIRVTYSF